MAQFENVYHESRGLTLEKDHDHAITSTEGASIPNMSPYMHPYYQKNKFEKIVE
jgi:hypothetical protein